MLQTLQQLDTSLFHALNGLMGRVMWFDVVVYVCAVVLIFVLIAFVIVDVVRRDVFKKRRASLSRDLSALVLTLSSSYGITEIIRDIIGRTRPLWEHSTPFLITEIIPSFPSGHTSFAFALATFLFLLREKRAAAVVYTLGTLIGISRIIAGVHYPSDIIGGALVGTGIAWAVHFVLSRAPKR